METIATPPEVLSELETLLGTANVVTASNVRRAASRDYSWLSPILSQKLPDSVADAVVYPSTTEEMAAVLRVAFATDTPITPRGKGTGNYGQAVPLAGGIVLDTSRMDRVIAVEPGRIHAQAGVSFLALEAAAIEKDQQLRIFPSTTNSYLAGFISGGSGGTGSVRHGFCWHGFVEALTMVPCTADSEPFTVRGEATLDYIHTYGTTGLIAEAVVGLEPRQDWTGIFGSFAQEDWPSACQAGLEIMGLGVTPRLLSIDQPGFLRFYKDHPGLPEGRISFRVIADTSTRDAIANIIAATGGRIDLDDPASCPLHTFLSYNHASLHAKQFDRGLCHLQVGGPPVIDHADEICSTLPESVLHLDGMKVANGAFGFGGLLISRYVSDERLYEAMAKFRAMGCNVVDPHHWYLGMGHFPTLERLQTAAAKSDPKGLLNPGRFPPPEVFEAHRATLRH